MSPDPLNSLGDTQEFNRSLEKSGNFVPPGDWTLKKVSALTRCLAFRR